MAKAAAMLCQDTAFRLYLDRRARARFGADVPDGTHTEQDARDWLCRACQIDSRAMLDQRPQAARQFRIIRNRFNHWRAKHQGGS